MGRRRACLILACLCAVTMAGIAAGAARAESNGLALTPPMGWNDWYSAFCAVNAGLVEQTAQAMVSNGMQAAGYQYVNIDDCWMAPNRDSAGNLVADPTRFPGGIKPVADFVHGLGLKLGIYEDAGTSTCAHYPGSYGHETQDAAAFAAWGVDYVKYDRCGVPYGEFPGQSEQQVQQTLFTRMSDALRATGRPIVFSMVNPEPTINPWEWAAPIANLWRTAIDTEDNFGSMLATFEGTVDLSNDARPGAWNDPDLLQIGNGGSTPFEYRTEFSLWAELAAPLIASTSITRLPPAALAILENRDVIAVDQDPLGRQAVSVARANGLWVLTKPLAGGDRSVVLFNSTNTAARITTTATAVGLPGGRAYRLQDLWSGALTQSGGTIRAFVPAHGVKMYRVGAVARRLARWMVPHTVLSLAPAAPELLAGHSTIVRETFADDGVTPVNRVHVFLRAGPGWRIKRLGKARAKRVAAGHPLSVDFRVTAPAGGPPFTLAPLIAAAAYDPPGDRQIASATLDERVFAPVPGPFATANTTGSDAAFGAHDGAFAISARGAGVLQPVNAAPTDSYAAIYEPQRAGPSSAVQVTITSDPAGGVAGGAGLIERDAMSAPAGSPPGVALFVSGSGGIVMSWNASGGQNVDSRFAAPGVIVHAPVTLRLVRSGSTYTGYYSTDRGVTFQPLDTVTVAGNASAGSQDVGVFHASGFDTWTTTATFAGLSIE